MQPEIQCSSASFVCARMQLSVLRSCKQLGRESSWLDRHPAWETWPLEPSLDPHHTFELATWLSRILFEALGEIAHSE